ncbi:hypothetical protein [uncultured Bacteroides sp.]|uniref:hypothetical protein n=1 Tax=uncultured Bacteroides sp. TaxID=162156 RepID=UPI002AA9226C|nr:hypothetical protein [uncultured Bacteroides sp.]
MVLSKIENHFLLFLKKNPSVCSKEFLFGKGFWRYYPNNSLAWNRYNMQYHNMDLPLDERLKVCLSDFQNSRLADNPLLEEKAFALLEQIQQEVAVAPNGISLAKWGCLVECLAQNFFLEGELDELLEETDDFLITLWRGGLNEANVGISQLFLWMGDYFLFRFCDKRSQCYSYSFQMLEQMLHCLLQFFSQLLHSSMYVEPVFLFPISFWQDLEWWLLRISEFSVSEFAKKALDNLYALPDSEILLRCIPPMNALRWQLRNGIFLNVSQGL